MSTTNVYIPKLQMDYLDDPQNLFQITDESARNFIDESLLVLMSKNCATSNAIRPQTAEDRQPSSTSTSENEVQSKVSTIRSFERESRSAGTGSTQMNKSRLPMSPRDTQNFAVALSPRYQQMKTRMTQSVG
ncbi:hypothetical protein M3Y95_00447200 [Aphelenchoides besseyi]|nr:hypothetical protein M3Y95_00447200 [Aphelenchoides besseyi]